MFVAAVFAPAISAASSTAARVAPTSATPWPAISSAVPCAGSPMWLHYVSSKGAIIAMTRALARELGDDRITVNAIAPGFALTQASLGLVENAAECGVTRGALKRAAVAGDMVGAALFLASPQASFITG